MPEINGHNYEPGCYADGRWGNYALSHMLERADEILGTSYWDDAQSAYLQTPTVVCTETDDGYTYSDGPTPAETGETIWDGFTFEFLPDIADEAETALNDATPEGFVWHWHDGEFFLSHLCDDETTCEDETCAHWC